MNTTQFSAPFNSEDAQAVANIYGNFASGGVSAPLHLLDWARNYNAAMQPQVGQQKQQLGLAEALAPVQPTMPRQPVVNSNTLPAPIFLYGRPY